MNNKALKILEKYVGEYQRQGFDPASFKSTFVKALNEYGELMCDEQRSMCADRYSELIDTNLHPIDIEDEIRDCSSPIPPVKVGDTILITNQWLNEFDTYLTVKSVDTMDRAVLVEENHGSTTYYYYEDFEVIERKDDTIKDEN